MQKISLLLAALAYLGTAQDVPDCTPTEILFGEFRRNLLGQTEEGVI